MSEPLKLCPFCGGHAILYREDKMYTVRCNKCCNGTIMYNAPQNAISAWNRRIIDEE